MTGCYGIAQAIHRASEQIHRLLRRALGVWVHAVHELTWRRAEAEEFESLVKRAREAHSLGVAAAALPG